MRTNTCRGITIGLQVAAMWLGLLNAASSAEFVHAPGRQDDGIAFATTFCNIRGNVCRQSFRHALHAQMGLAQLDRSSFQPVWTCHGAGAVRGAPRSIVAAGARRPFAKRDFCICIGRTWGHPTMCVRSLDKHATRPAGRCCESQAVLEVEPA